MSRFIEEHPYYLAFTIITFIISMASWIMSKSFGTGLLVFGILSFVIVGIISMYNNFES